jgi:hypothetical protein
VQQSILLQVAEIIISEGGMIGGNNPYGTSPIPTRVSNSAVGASKDNN